jgi:hypothetical protein
MITHALSMKKNPEYARVVEEAGIQTISGPNRGVGKFSIKFLVFLKVYRHDVSI